MDLKIIFNLLYCILLYPLKIIIKILITAPFKFINLFFFIFIQNFTYKLLHIQNFFRLHNFFLLNFKMTYNSIEEIEAAYPEPENETKAERTKRLRNMN